MATSPQLTPGKPATPDSWINNADQPVFLKLGWLNGLFLGLGIALGAWSIPMISLAKLPVLLPYHSTIVSTLFIVGLCMLSGLLTTRLHRIGISILLWLLTAVVIITIISHQPTTISSWMVWLADRRFWGYPIYPHPADSFSIYLIAGFSILLLLVSLALIQSYRLEGVLRELGKNGRLSPRSLLLLLLPLPFAFAAGAITTQFMGNASADALSLVYAAIEGGRNYEGDLFELGLKDGINYSAFRAVQEQMTPTYTLAIGGEDPASASTFVIVFFDNDLWVSCRVINKQLSFCADASPPYVIGLNSLITGDPVPEQCLNCSPAVTDTLAHWLATRKDRFNGTPHISRAAQWGSYVLMEAKATDGTYGLTCWFSGVRPIQLDSCTAQ